MMTAIMLYGAMADVVRRVSRALVRLRRCLECNEDCHRRGILKT
jgi:hypothetical protein